jgi:hypothetical protein
MKIAFYKATRPGMQGWFSRIVRWWTNGVYSHCEAVLADNDGVHLCGSASFLDGGVRLKWIELNPEHWDFVEIPADKDSVYRWFKEHAGCKYDLMGLVRYVARRGDGSRNRFVCGESIAAAIGATEAWRFDPNTFFAAVTFNANQGA